ncbi:hypothetical protein J8L70_14210 [Pseudoalteromonas sp. MMG010]|uniref:hypothetical protein n=1 Tax=Pseudoalteromonas sp. MMG010 TaxID=2822685 RepID=UPI001B3A5FAB|nr:hypothetical protein [Pseudoalteromonas sp. MMG010]MBQ4834403.1 hypothetical protein [Pseudoalteromonas sp. MMG010]
MGVRLALKKDLMGLDNSGLLTADDVRSHLKSKVGVHTCEQSFSIISKFNDSHCQIVCGEFNKKTPLKYQRHRLFKEILYTRSSVDAWFNSQTSHTNQ